MDLNSSYKPVARPRQFTLRALIVVVAVICILLAWAATVPGMINWLLLLGCFYVPLGVVWFFVRSPTVLAISVFVIHTVAILAVEGIWHVVGQPPEFVKVAVLVLYEVWLLPVYLALEPSGLWRLSISLLAGGASWSLIGWKLADWRLHNPPAATERDAQRNNGAELYK